MQAANVNIGLNLESASFVSGAEQARRAMVSNLAAIQQESARTATSLAAVPNSLKGFSSANDNLKKFGNIAQQAGYQVGDFAVQIAAGGNAMTAFIQQGTQILGVLGPMGAVIGAAGAVLGIFVKTLYDSGTNAEDAQAALDKLTKSTDAYREALERVRPLEIARLQNIIDYTTAAEAAAAVRFAPEAVIGRQLAGNIAQNPFAPGAGMLPGGLNPFTGQPIQQEVQQGKAAINRYEQMTAEYLDAQYRARQRIEKAQQEIRDRNKPGIIAKAEFKPGLDARDYVQAEEAAAAASAAISTGANNKRIADAERTAAALKRLEEDRAEDFAESLKRDQDELEKHLADRQKIYADAYQNIADENEKALADEQRARDRAAEQQAEIYAQPFKDLATNISNTLSSGIQDALSGDFDFTTFAEGFGDIFADTLASSITAVLTPFLTDAAKSFGDVLTNALKGGTAVGGVPGAGLTPGGAALGGALFGGIAGGLYGQYGGLKPGNQAGLGGALGGGVGAGLGAFLMPANPLLGAGIGGSLGGLLGSLTGGLFGGQNNLGNDRSAQQYRAGRGITYSDASFSAENRQVTQGIIDQLTALQEALETAGGAIADFGLRIEAGNKSGITVNGKQYPNAQAALAASLEVLIGSTTGLTASQQTVLTNTKAKDAQGIVADLGVAEQFDALTFTGTALEAALKALDRQMRAFAERAGELGLSVDAVAAAHQREAQALVDAQTAEQNQIRGAIEAIAPSGSALEVGLAQLNDQVQGLAKAATAAGLPLDQLAAAHVRAASQLYAAAAQAKAAVNLQIAQINPTTNPLDLQLMQLQAQIDSLKPALDATGQSYDELAKAHQAAAAKIIFDYETAQRVQREAAGQARAQAEAQARAAAAQARENERQRQLQLAAQRTSIYQQLAGLYGDNTLTGRLKTLAAEIKQLAQAAADAGVPIKHVTDAHTAAAAELVRVFDQQRRVAYQEIQSVAGDKSLNAQLIALANQMRELTKTASDLGIPVVNVSRAWAAAYQELERAYNQQVRGVYEQIQAAAGDTTLSAQLNVLETQMRELTKTASDLGIPVVHVSRAWTAAHKELERAYNQRVRGVYEQIQAAAGDRSFPAQLNVLETQMRELAKAASDVGIPLNLVTAAHKAAAEELARVFSQQSRGVYAKIAAARGDDSLAQRLENLQTDMQELAHEAQSLGIPLQLVTDAHKAAAYAIHEQWEETLRDMRRQQRDLSQSILEGQRSAAGAVDQFLSPLKEALSSRGIGQGVYSGASLTESGLKEFREALKEARTGDTGALSSLVGIGQGALAQARQTYGSTTAFAEIFREVEAGLREQQGVLEAKRDELLTQIGTFTRETVDELIRLRTQAVADLRADFAKLSKDIVVAVEGRA